MKTLKSICAATALTLTVSAQTAAAEDVVDSAATLAAEAIVKAKELAAEARDQSKSCGDGGQEAR